MPDMAAFEADYGAPLTIERLEAGTRDDRLVRKAAHMLGADHWLAELDRVRADYERCRTALLGY